MHDYYVYVYIDPRNFEEFYFGKGRGSRKNAHLHDSSDSEKARRIKAIHKEGLEPIIRVVARNLSEHDAFLVEKTLLWKLGRTLTNVATGHYGQNFRPHDTLHQELTGFDFQNGVYYYNVGEGRSRHWDDYREFGFISAGQGIRFRDAMLGFNPGDVVVAYLKRRKQIGGYVGVAKIKTSARPVSSVRVRGKPLLEQKLRRGLADNVHDDERCEYVCLVDWIVEVERAQALWKPKSGLYTTQWVRASLEKQSETIAFVEDGFKVSLGELVK